MSDVGVSDSGYAPCPAKTRANMFESCRKIMYQQRRKHMKCNTKATHHFLLAEDVLVGTRPGHDKAIEDVAREVLLIKSHRVRVLLFPPLERCHDIGLYRRPRALHLADTRQRR